MTPSEFSALAAECHGDFGWKIKLAQRHGVAVSTASRWGRGEIPIPAAAIKGLRSDAARKIEVLKRAVA